MKAYTGIEQSKVLAKILPIKSADMAYGWAVIDKEYFTIPYCRKPIDDELPCWSIAALLAIFPDHLYFGSERMQFGIDKMGSLYNAYYEAKDSFWQIRADNPVDACYGMMLKLKEKNLLKL